MSASTRASSARPNNARKRVPKACVRCRDQKIRCSGSQPCQQCDKRGLTCRFDDESRKVVVSRGYINRLQEKLASLENKANQQTLIDATAGQSESPEFERIALSGDNHDISGLTIKPSASISPYGPAETQHQQTGSEAKAPLINPLAFHTYDFVPGITGQLLFMGTSSNWSFNKRVLTMTHERLTGTPLPTHNLHFAGLEGKVFDLRWDGTRRSTTQDIPDMSTLPTKDFALYLINSVKFHCSWLYNLFDEDVFMKRFHRFHKNRAEHIREEPLWFVHYLLVLALGKAFVVQSTKSRRPPGSDFFVQAMKLMPDFNFFECDIIDEMQVLCCAALYLQCVDRIQEAYRLVCSALRHGLEYGIHTEMQPSVLDEAYVQRCRHMFWTIYILERQMGSLQGLPLGISDEVISARFPVFPGQPQKLEALKIHVDFCRVLAKIDQTVYGLEGKLDSRYLGATQEVLKSIATVTERLNKSFEVQTSEGMAETFLRFDQDATLTATIALLMASAIDSSLLPDHSPWTQRAYAILDEMGSRGNLVAPMVASELKQLEGLLRGFLLNNEARSLIATQENSTPREVLVEDMEPITEPITGYAEPFNLDSEDEFGLGLNYELSAEQLLNIANSLDIDSLTWPWPEDPMVEGT
ncbi:Ff.00g052860.m01.CDS01 [Fusarium sp. VM40]|nr:Ff.00g052860.m01.CDS01 [Fusarium sp. VM40]